jgi:hypothetical protein
MVCLPESSLLLQYPDPLPQTKRHGKGRLFPEFQGVLRWGWSRASVVPNVPLTQALFDISLLKDLQK